MRIIQHYIKPAAVLAFILLGSLSLGQRVSVPMDTGFYSPDSAAVRSAEATAAAATDTVVRRTELTRSNDFYERLEESTGNSLLTRTVFNALVTDADKDGLDIDDSKTLIDKTGYFSKYEGQKILSVRIYRNNVFERSSSRYSLNHWANTLHVVTRESRIRNNLLFEEGQEVVAADMVRSQYLLRSLSYISEADIVMVPSGGPGGGVDVVVVTRDRWTIGVEGRLLGERRYMGEIYDNNFLGYGNRFSVGVYAALKGTVYGGNIVEYNISNLWGTFIQADLYAGEGYYEQKYGGRISRIFIRPTDYMGGAVVEQIQDEEFVPLSDTTRVIRQKNIEFWLGRSFYNKWLRSSFFAVTDYNNQRFYRRPDVAVDSNTYYQNHKTALLSLGIYRESYYHGSMIHGFGNTEDIPYGYKVELTGGRYWGEFENKYYAGASVSMGRQQRFGYFRVDLAGSTFFDGGGAKQGMLDVGINFFSNLLPARRSRIRQFVNLKYTKGFSRYKGEGELLTFTEDYTPRGGITVRNIHGDSRLVLNTETVVFAPWYWYGFRFALFGYWDSAFIGYDNNPFRNPYYSTVGMGVRIRNERLIFNTIQFRLGVALGPNGFMDSDYFRVSGEPRLRQEGYKPMAPAIQEFR